jgi:hypothetical protein
MIVVEKDNLNGREFTHTYSDKGMMIQKVGTDEIYSDAYDVLDFEYVESEIPIELPPVPEKPAQNTPEQMAEALRILGVEA